MLLPVSSITPRGLPGRPHGAMMPPSARCAENCAASNGPLASLPTLAPALPPAGREIGPAPSYDAAPASRPHEGVAPGAAWPGRAETAARARAQP